MCVVIKSRPEFKMGHVGSKTRSLGQFLEKPCVLSRRHSFDPVFMKLCQNDFLTLNKRLSRRAMLSDDSSCYSLAYLNHKYLFTSYNFLCNTVKGFCLFTQMHFCFVQCLFVMLFFLFRTCFVFTMFGATFAINCICICLSIYVKQLQGHTAQLLVCQTEELEVMV